MTETTDNKGPVERVLMTLEPEQILQADRIFKKIVRGQDALDGKEEQFILDLIDKLVQKNNLKEGADALPILMIRFNPAYSDMVQRLDKSIHTHIFGHAMHKQSDAWQVLVRLSALMLIAAHLQIYFTKAESHRAYEPVS